MANNVGGRRPGAGRPRKEHLATARELIQAVISPADFETMVRAMYDRAVAGDYRAFCSLMDRYYGKPTERIETTNTNMNETRVIVEFEDAPTVSLDEDA